MEVVASTAEVASFLKKNTLSFVLFPESRRNPIRMTSDLPVKWVNKPLLHTIKDTVFNNEYYTFQIGLLAAGQNLDQVQISYKGNSFPVTCFNVEGRDSKGNFFKKPLNVTKGKVQALWFGADISKKMSPGIKKMQVLFKVDKLPVQIINVELLVLPKQLKNRGDDDLWRHSRLRWLNSNLGINDDIVQPYRKLILEQQTISALMSKVTLKDDGFPKSIYANQKELLQQPIAFNIMVGNKQEDLDHANLKFIKQKSGKIEWLSSSSNLNFEVSCKASMEFDGYLHYRVNVKSKKDIEVSDINLNIPVKKEQAAYFMGMGLPGMKCPENYNWKWKGPQDSYWIGNSDAGLFCELRGATYNGPLLNLYHPAAPPAWYNHNIGGFSIDTNTNAIVTKTYTGSRQFLVGDSIQFEFSLMPTPVKNQQTEPQFTNRYYHNGQNPEPSVKDLESGVRVINVHHANSINPYINYPFISVDSIKKFVDKWHQKRVKTKIYYTIRELSNQASELWALRSLGTEILADGKGGGYTWLREHVVDHYNPQWFTPIQGGESSEDAALLTSGESRWYNYYIEGLKWMFEKTNMDGLYLDDVSFDREMLKRMRRVMAMVKPDAIMDLQSNTGFSRGPATQYMEFFPYIDKLWFGESFQYDKMSPQNWLVEVSGIPFGLMGDMLHAGGNPWRGMVYGMTVRYPWYTEGVNCDPREIWKVWDSFGIASSKMMGYWDKANPVKTTNPSVLATAYVKQDSILVAIASWAPNSVDVKLDIDWEKIGWKPEDVIIAPEIKNYQPEMTFKLDESIQVEPVKGWLLLFKKKK